MFKPISIMYSADNNYCFLKINIATKLNQTFKKRDLRVHKGNGFSLLPSRTKKYTFGFISLEEREL